MVYNIHGLEGTPIGKRIVESDKKEYDPKYQQYIKTRNEVLETYVGSPNGDDLAQKVLEERKKLFALSAKTLQQEIQNGNAHAKEVYRILRLRALEQDKDARKNTGYN